jgi:hypothetical protein
MRCRSQKQRPRRTLSRFKPLPSGQLYQLATVLDRSQALDRIRHRGDTLGGPVLDIDIFSPADNIVGVRITHISSDANVPCIPLFPDGRPPQPNISTATTEKGVKLTSGNLTAEVTSNPYTLTFSAEGKTLTYAGAKYQGIFDVPTKWTALAASNQSCLNTDFDSNPNPPVPQPKVRYVNSELNISPGELFYGFGCDLP